jgi:DNA repair photolyase
MAEKFKILINSEIPISSRAPVILSASRSTDIPAFYAQWFINRLKAGYCVWYNPFNQQSVHVSFKNARAVVFWSKNPRPMIPYLHELDGRGIHYYFQFTLNDYEKELFEPNVPPVEKRMETFRELSGKIGREKVIWRFDPLVMTDKIGIDELLRKVENIDNQLNEYTEKLVFSFADLYKKVENNLKRLNINYREFTPQTMHELAAGLQKLNQNWHFSLATCTEEIDLEPYGIEHNRCIDGEWMERIFAEDREFTHYLSRNKLKDRGQRKSCGCMISKDIGMYNTCPHFCVYCYANTSQETVLKNRKLHAENRESIVRS